MFNSEQIQQLASRYYGFETSVQQLPGEIDLNFQLKTGDGQKFILKIANAAEQPEQLKFQNNLIRRLAEAGLGLEIPEIIPTLDGAEIQPIPAPDGSLRQMRLLRWIEGRCIAEVRPHSPELLYLVGAMLGKLSKALEGFDDPAAHRFIKWDPSQAGWTKDSLHLFPDERKKSLASYFFDLFEQKARPLFPTLRQSVTYGDANDYNILVGHDLAAPSVPGVIDFGDAVYSHTVNELAVAAAYLTMDKPDPLAVIRQLTAGFHSVFPLTEPEAAALFPLTCARLLISVTCSNINLREHPENEYLQISDRPAWALLEKFRGIHPTLVHAAVRQACGWEPMPQNAVFRDWVARNRSRIHPVVDANLDNAVWLDLSVGSPDLGNYADIEDADMLHRRISDVMNGRPGIGRYNEIRPFYTTDAYAVRGNNGPQWRTVHIGLDIFLDPGANVYAPVEGVVHSFQDNANDRDYGPTIILEHRVEESFTFYTLYGHLTRSSLNGLAVGRHIKAGEAFCQIGPMPENGNWSPHLHFQVMLHALGKEGDYPGVAFPEQRAIWTSLCPDPWVLLGGRPSPPAEVPDTGALLQYRQEHLGKNLSLSYRRPLHIQRGWRQYLFDEHGRRYLDTVNNVAHVGHEHPRVVRAGQRQMAVLNTNTRYLHTNIVRFAEALLSTFPSPLEVAFFVNSGSEANELALRLAKNYTGQRDVIAVEVGYHGNTQGCIDISSYKFEGPGGKGAPPGVKVAPIPDTYRGKYRGNHAESGRQYAAHVAQAVAAIRQEGRAPAAFICESIISCGGQVTLPPEYLKTAVPAVRAAGGVYIADEVQTGCGRHGTHFWAFQESGVTPDIVTVGKPIGNGHPLGVVVTTRAIADAFANGMEYFNTFGGNPVSCAIGLEVLKVIKEEGLQQNALEVGTCLQKGLHEIARQHPVMGDVRGAGLFLGFELVDDPETRAPAAQKASYLANRMCELGVLMSIDGPLHNVLKIKPPIVFSQKDAAFLLEMLADVFQEDFMRRGIS